MAYETSFSGEIRIDPPIPAEALEGTGFTPDRHNGMDVTLRISEIPVDGVPGAYRRMAVAVVPAMTRFSGYDIVEHLQRLLSLFGEGRTFTGRFDCAGEEAGDLWRLEVHDGRAVKVEPRIVWPDSSEGAR
jgi:hypothetical protein